MAWTAPPTAVTGAVITAAFWNTGGRDNLNDLDRRSSPVQGYVLATETTTSTSYTDLATAGPAVTVTVGSTGKAIIALYAGYRNASGNFALMAWAVSGASTFAAADGLSLQTATTSDVRNGGVLIAAGLTAGSNTFTAKYRASGGTAEFNNRFLWVTPLGA